MQLGDITITANTLFAVNHSGGKDSQALGIYLVEHLGIPKRQIVFVHADLGDVEWKGTEEHAREGDPDRHAAVPGPRAEDGSGRRVR